MVWLRDAAVALALGLLVGALAMGVGYGMDWLEQRWLGTGRRLAAALVAAALVALGGAVLSVVLMMLDLVWLGVLDVGE
jgi:hypothetical protein